MSSAGKIAILQVIMRHCALLWERGKIMAQPEISVIVPIYNVEKYLNRCVDSVLGQTFSDLEVLLVDDGSPDGCGAVCDEYAAKDARVRVIHKPNGGLSSARNAGLEVAAGRWIAFADSDDWLDSDMLEILHTAALKHGAQIAECSYRRIYRGRTEEETLCTGACMEATNVDALGEMYDWKHFKPVAWNKLYLRDVIGDVRYPVGRLHEDEFTTYRFDWNAEKLVFVDVSKYNYDCSRENSITGQAFRDGHLDVCFAFHERIDFLRARGVKQLEKKALDGYCWVLFDQLYKAYRAGLRSAKLREVLKVARQDAREFQSREIEPCNLKTLELIASGGLRAFGKMRDKQEGV